MRKNIKSRIYSSDSFFVLALIVLPWISSCQLLVEAAPPSYIRTIDFRGSNEIYQFPIIKLGEPLFLSFDDIRAQEADYYYKIEHANFDWNRSDLSKPEYLDGFDDQRIQDYQNSINTLQPFSHYSLKLPNSFTRIRVTGNYVISIYDSYGELIFSRRFVVYDPQAAVQISIHRSRDMNVINQKQVVYFEIGTPSIQLRDPSREVKVALLQNYRWETAITGLKPQYSLAENLIYRYDGESSFWAGNEFLNFDTKDIRAATVAIQQTRLQDIYHNYLFTDIIRANKPYTFFPDINGDFKINTLQGESSSLEADYSWVHFSLENTEQTLGQRLFVVGRFNNFLLSDENELYYDASEGLYSAEILLKQGFYNYRYVLLDQEGRVQETTIEGDFWQTENIYVVLVYYRLFNARYDSVIGFGITSSEGITN